MADAVLLITKKGYGKVVEETEFPTKGRGGKGVSGFKVTDDSGPVTAAEHVKTVSRGCLGLSNHARFPYTSIGD